MAPAAPAQTRCGVTLGMSLGIGFTLGFGMLIAPYNFEKGRDPVGRPASLLRHYVGDSLGSDQITGAVLPLFCPRPLQHDFNK